MNVKVKEILKNKGSDIWSVGPSTTVLDALALMAEKNIGAVLVTEGERLVGIFSERDFARKVVVDSASFKDAVIEELMTRKLISVKMDTGLHECLTLITENRIRHLPVVEGDKLLGMLTIGDVVKHIISHLETTVRDLENYISGGGYGS